MYECMHIAVHSTTFKGSYFGAPNKILQGLSGRHTINGSNLQAAGIGVIYMCTHTREIMNQYLFK